MTQPKILRLPDPKARKERQLIAAWEREAELRRELREAERVSRKLEREVGRAMGYGEFIRREALELAVKREGR